MRYYSQFLVEFLEQRYVDLKVLVVVSNIYKGAEELMRENQLKGFAVFLYRVEEPEESQTQNLYFVLSLRVFSGILTLFMITNLILHSFSVGLYCMLCNFP